MWLYYTVIMTSPIRSIYCSTLMRDRIQKKWSTYIHYILCIYIFSTFDPSGTIGPARVQTLKIITISTDTKFDTLIYTLCGEISKKSRRTNDVLSRRRRRRVAMTLNNGFFDASVAVWRIICINITTQGSSATDVLGIRWGEGTGDWDD